jgi:hypothetical protein
MSYSDGDPGHTNAHNDHANQISAVQTALSGKADASHTHGQAGITNLVTDMAVVNSRLSALEVTSNRGVLVLAPAAPVPAGTPSGTIILRTS